MAVIDEVFLETLSRECREKKAAVVALVELVDGPTPGTAPKAISDAAAWVHKSFCVYRTGMADNDANLPRLARIEHDFIAAIGALNFDDQKRQLRQALRAIEALIISPDDRDF